MPKAFDETKIKCSKAIHWDVCDYSVNNGYCTLGGSCEHQLPLRSAQGIAKTNTQLPQGGSPAGSPKPCASFGAGLECVYRKGECCDETPCLPIPRTASPC